MSIRSIIKENQSLIFTIGASAGVLTTAYLAAKAGAHAARVIDQVEEIDEPLGDRYGRLRERSTLVWRLYIPTAVSAAGTIGCLIAVKRVDGRKTLAAQAALAVTQGAYSEYRDKIVEEFGEKKDQKILAKVAESKVDAKPPSAALIVGEGEVLCCELYTMRYFKCDMQKLRNAVNEVNARMLRNDVATLDDFYYLVGLEFTGGSSYVGWKADRLMDLEFSSTLYDGRPVLAFDYNYTTSF